MHEIQKGEEKRLYVWGGIQYVDVFKEGRNTIFRLMYGGPESTKRTAFWWCDKGNKAT